jgi:hypothetical protein
MKCRSDKHVSRVNTKTQTARRFFQYTNAMLIDLSFDGQLRKTLKRHMHIVGLFTSQAQ